jgi:erythronate-4-phosphate dehydrogenase
MTLGVVGAGNVGSKVAKVGRALGMRVLLNDPPRAKVEGSEGFASLEEVQAEADFISVHVPLTLDGPDKTFQLAAPAFFGKLAKKPFFINSSRGEVVSGDALKEAIRRGQVSGAALDVWENEPDIDLELLRLLDFATPHIAGYSTDGKANGTAMSVNALAGYFKLPMYEFFPMNVPEPPRATIELAPAASFEKTLFDAVSVSYDIAEDDARLRAKPSDFERLRGDYPLRREFPAYAVSPRGDLGREPLEALAKLGFKIV